MARAIGSKMTPCWVRPFWNQFSNPFGAWMAILPLRTGCAYQLHAGIYRRICANGLVLSSHSFQAIRFRHAGLLAQEVVQASFRLLDFLPRVGELVERFRAHRLQPRRRWLWRDMRSCCAIPASLKPPSRRKPCSPRAATGGRRGQSLGRLQYGPRGARSRRRVRRSS